METFVLSPNVYKTSQVNGQRITVNHIISSEGKGYEVFIGHLPRDMFESELLPVLMSVGQLCELRIMMNFSGLNRGFAFARFNNQESADNAVRYLNNFEVREGRKIAVIHSKDKTKLFIGHFPRHLKEDTINKILNTITENIVKVEMKSYTKSGSYHRFSIVEYKSHKDACNARRALVIAGRATFQSDILVDWAFAEKENIVINKDILRTGTSNSINRKLNDKTPNLASEMNKLRIGDSQRKAGGRRAVEIYRRINGSEGSISPTNSYRSDDNFYQRPKKPCNNNNRVFISSGTPSPSQTSCPQMEYGILRASMIECQLCGPSCTFKKSREHSKRVVRTLELNSSRVI